MPEKNNDINKWLNLHFGATSAKLGKHDPKLNRTRVQIVESVRTGKKVRQKILRYVGVAHNDGEVEVIKRSVRQLMEQLRADRTHQKELFSPPNMPIFKKLFTKLHVLNSTLYIMRGSKARIAVV